MSRRPRVLVLAQSLPYPPQCGVASRTFNVLKQLQEGYDVDLVAFSRVSHQRDRVARDAAWRALQAALTRVAEPTPIPNEHSAFRKLCDHARSLVSGRAYTHYEYASRSFAQRLRAALRAGRPDLVHLDSLDVHRWLPELPRQVPIACTHHDIDPDLLRQRARRLNPVLRRYLLLQADRLERLTRALCPRFALNVMMSDVDARRLQTLAPGAPTVVVPNGTDTDFFQPSGQTPVPGRIVFVGPTYSHPNRDAVDFLLREIWPRIRAADRGASLQLIGGNAPADRARYRAEPGVTVLGQVPDIRPLLVEASCCVVPIRIGGGTRLKILDAWAMGKAVISTAIGCEGLEGVDGANILIRDRPDAMAEAVVQVLHDSRLRARLEDTGRRTATATYDWAVVGQQLRAAYDELLTPSRTLAAAAS
jgi:glycosyltransferase involved in cell wall biosynthesis